MEQAGKHWLATNWLKSWAILRQLLLTAERHIFYRYICTSGDFCTYIYMQIILLVYLVNGKPYVNKRFLYYFKKIIGARKKIYYWCTFMHMFHSYYTFRLSWMERKRLSLCLILEIVLFIWISGSSWDWRTSWGVGICCQGNWLCRLV